MQYISPVSMGLITFGVVGEKLGLPVVQSMSLLLAQKFQSRWSSLVVPKYSVFERKLQNTIYSEAAVEFLRMY